MNKYFYLMFCFFSVSSSFAQVGSKHRPLEVQKAVDSAFVDLNQQSCFSYEKKPSVSGGEGYHGGWLYNGVGFYGLMGFDEEAIIREIANRDDSQTDVYLIDVGSAAGGWGREAERFIRRELRDCDKHFHIFNITGSNESEIQGVFTFGNVTQYRFNRFRIEALKSELLERGIDITGKVDLIVSNWTLRHLVDPFGTLEDMYELLSPKQGVLIANGFFSRMYDSEGRVIENHDGDLLSTIDLWSVFSYSSALFVLREWDNGLDLDQFILIKTNELGLNLPIDYQGSVEHEKDGRSYQIQSGRVCAYSLKMPLQKKPSEWRTKNKNYYGNQESHAAFDKFNMGYWVSDSVLERRKKREEKRVFDTLKAIHLGGKETPESAFIKKILKGQSSID